MIKLIQAEAVLADRDGQVQTAFADEVAVSELLTAAVERAEAAAAGGPLNMTSLRDSAARGLPPAQGFSAQPGAVPFGALKLYRSLLARTAIASSWRVRAASTPSDDGGVTRKVGGFDVSLIREPDMAFLVIGNVTDTAPHRMLLLAEDGDAETISLPTPIDGNIQLVLGDDEASKRIIALAGAVTTSVYLH